MVQKVQVVMAKLSAVKQQKWNQTLYYLEENEKKFTGKTITKYRLTVKDPTVCLLLYRCQ